MTPPSRSLGPPTTSAPTDPRHASRTRRDLTAVPAPLVHRTPRRKSVSGFTPGSGKG
ncbi:hypothetical protein [Streptomyces sp. NPDC006012]|uniref:hypothetical protein n=1 Tax=Streptomyces sp. NPDC006012 TaxID=3364739 RepID=UPI0036778A02